MSRSKTQEVRDWVREDLRGYIVVLYTPFDEDGEIDLPAFCRNIERTLALPGVAGLSVNTIHQEFWTFTLEQRELLVETALKTVNGRAPVVIGCSDPSAHTVAHLARHADRNGADLVMIWPPYYGPRTRCGMRDFYDNVASNSDIAFLAYSTTLTELGYHLTAEEVEKMLDIGAFCGVQNTTLDIALYAKMLRRVGDRIAVATSLEEYHYFGKSVYPGRTPNFLIGSSRPIFCQSARLPICGDFIAAILAGDLPAATPALRRILAIAEQLQSRYFSRGIHHVSLFKALAEATGMETGAVRPPDSPPSADELAACLAILKSEGVLPPDTEPRPVGKD